MSSPTARRYKDPPGINSISVGDAFEEFIATQHRLQRLHWRDDQLGHGDAMNIGSEGPIYHEIKHDPHLDYRHLMIEVAANRTGDSGWHLGGIFSDSDAHYYWQGEERLYWRFAKPDLIDWAAQRGITRSVVVAHFAGKLTTALKEFQGTMLRCVMEYGDADFLGVRLPRPVAIRNDPDLD
jgi:hypothetical protein